MKQKLVIGSIFTAVVILLTSLSSVMGSISEESEPYVGVDSPLFSARTQQIRTWSSEKINSINYIGCEKSYQWINIPSTQYHHLISQALTVLNNQPGLVDSLLQYIMSNQYIQSILHTQGLSVTQIKQDLYTKLEDPEELQTYLAQYLTETPQIDPPQPLGLSTSSAIGCFIIVIAMLPLLLILTTLIATITLITCLNVGGCFEAIWTQIGENFIQGLSPN